MGGAGKGVFQALLEAGADVHAKDNVSLLLISSDPCGVESMTQVFSCLCCWICVKCVFFMLAPFLAKSLLRQDDFTALHLVYKCCTEVVQALLASGADVNAKNKVVSRDCLVSAAGGLCACKGVLTYLNLL